MPSQLGSRTTGLSEELDAIEPTDEVTFIHLAAMVSVPACEADPRAARAVNVRYARSATTAIIQWAESRQSG